MPDLLTNLMDSPPAKALTKQLGVPAASPLRRYEAGQPLLDGPVLLGGTGPLRAHAERVLTAAGAPPVPAPSDDDTRYGALVFDASDLRTVADLRRLYEFFHPTSAGSAHRAACSSSAARRRARRRSRSARWRASCARWPRSCAAARPGS